MKAFGEIGKDRSLAARVLLLLVAFTVPLVGAAAILISQQQAKIDVTERERVGLDFTRRVAVVVDTLSRLRDRVEIDGAKVGPNAGSVEAALSNLYDYDSGEGRALHMTKRLERLQDDWSAALTPRGASSNLDRACEDAVSLFYAINDRSLNIDSDPGTIALIDAAGVQMPTLAERAGTAKITLLRSVGENGERAGSDRLTSALLVGQAVRAYEIVVNDVATAERFGELSSDLHTRLLRLRDALKMFVAVARDDATGRASSLGSRADDLTSAIDGANTAFDDAISHALDGRSRGEHRALLLLQIEAALAIAVGIGIAVQIGRTIRDRDRRELERARSDAERLSSELDRQRALELLRVSEAQFRAVFDRSSIGVAILDPSGRVVRTNRAMAEIFGQVDLSIVGPANPSFARLIDGTIDSFTSELEVEIDGAPRWFEATQSLVLAESGSPLFAISMFKDITERRHGEDLLRYQASHDQLSGLPNRSHFVEAAGRVIFEERRRGEYAVLFVDLDEFKFVNDSLGHDIGDRVLAAAAMRLREAVRGDDLVARFGGDEFAVLLASREGAWEFAPAVERIGRALAEPLFVDGREIFLSASMGVAVVDDAYRTVEEIIRDADTAMYFAKAAGRSRAEFFNATMHHQASRRLVVATQLRRALERDQLYLAYQPVVSLADGHVEGFETLLRWEHPELGFVSPGEFIPIAEEIGAIVPIGRYVLENACRQLTAWKTLVDRPLRLSVNASVREILQSDYVEFVESLARRHSLRQGELVLEVTESTVLASGKFSAGALERIKAAGVALAIDDFGTGYSSLRYLQQFPFDELKIDRSFVSSTGDESVASEPIVTMLLALGKSCNVRVVAEGVETSIQAARLRALGAQSAQGYLYGAPTRAREAEAFLRRAFVVAS